MKRAARTCLSIDRYADLPRSGSPYKSAASTMLTSIAFAFVGLVSIAFDATIDGDLCLLRPHCTIMSHVRSLLFLFLPLSFSFLRNPFCFSLFSSSSKHWYLSVYHVLVNWYRPICAVLPIGMLAWTSKVNLRLNCKYSNAELLLLQRLSQGINVSINF